MLVADSNTELKTFKAEALARILLLFFQPQVPASPFEDLETEPSVGHTVASAADLCMPCCLPGLCGWHAAWLLSAALHPTDRSNPRQGTA